MDGDCINLKEPMYKILSLFVFTIVLNAHTTEIPLYKSGPRNVYYITGAGSALLTDAVFPNQDGWSLPYRALAQVFIEKGYNFYTTMPRSLTAEFKKNTFAIFQHNLPKPERAKQFEEINDRVVIVTTEPYHVMPSNCNPHSIKSFKKILTWDDTKVDNKKFFKYHFVQSTLDLISDIVPFCKKKLCTFIGSHKDFKHRYALYPKRREAILFFESYHSDEFDFYGRGWPTKVYKTYGGGIANKTNIYRNYKFAICYENITNTKGYITEKIFGCFVAGCVPVYWGATNITDFIPANCFIDKRLFSSLHDLYDYMKHMSEEEYNTYIKNIRNFLASPEAEKYSIDAFVKTLVNVLML